MGSVVADIFRQGARLHREDPRRQGNVIHLDEQDDVVLAGDVHGHRKNLARVISYADLAGAPHRRLILQEIVHGPLDPRSGTDRSGELLLRAVRLKVNHPEQVLMLMANHDLAQVTGNEIMKDGRGYCESFEAGVRHGFGDEAEEVLEAMNELFLSLPLAIRTPNRVWISHSLPHPRRMDKAGTDIFSRPCTPEDLQRGGPVYEWTWGRGQTDEQVAELAETLDVDYFLLGHRPTPMGFETILDRAATIGTDHEHGVVVHFPAGEPFDVQAPRRYVKPVAAL